MFPYREVVESEEFLALSPSQVCKLISSDKLAVPSEEKVYTIFDNQLLMLLGLPFYIVL